MPGHWRPEKRLSNGVRKTRFLSKTYNFMYVYIFKILFYNIQNIILDNIITKYPYHT